MRTQSPQRATSAASIGQLWAPIAARAVPLWAWFGRVWQRRWFRLLTYSAAVGALAVLIALLILWYVLTRDLPSVAQLRNYESPLPTMVRDSDGLPVHSYARDRRVRLEYHEYPTRLVQAYLAAEDKTFFEHGGLDYPGIARAVLTNITSDGRPVGASTITQQVAKNLLLSSEVTYRRKMREIILARRIERALSKERILELYLNQIALGRRSFGVQAAARAYFDKDVNQLALHEMAFLATLPKAPERYGRARYASDAKQRRDYILGNMHDNDWITAAERDSARAMPLGLGKVGRVVIRTADGYYMEEVRRRLVELFGETAADGGRNSVYEGGLWVRSAYDASMQAAATNALRAGLLRYDRNKGWSGPIATIPADDKWRSHLLSSTIGIQYENWRIAVVLSKNNYTAELGFADGSKGILPARNASLRYRGGRTAFQSLRAGYLLAVQAVGRAQATRANQPQAPSQTAAPLVYRLRNIPAVSGAIFAQNPYSGRVYAMQGGFDVRLSSFNRATQAKRQPGSAIKPFVYATALDMGMTPASLVIDGPFCIFQTEALGEKCFKNFDGSSDSEPRTIRWGLEQSRNLITVRIASQIGMEPIVSTIRTMGIGDPPPYLSVSLGAGETSLDRMVNAYASFVNQGRKQSPRLIDYVQDRHGKVIYPTNWRACRGCNQEDWDGAPMPRFGLVGEQLMNPMTAYQVLYMLEGVVQRGTARRLRSLNRPLFGKTGTSNGPNDVWFIGGSADLVAGVYIGYDQPRSLGGYAQGSSIAAPIFKQFAESALTTRPPLAFVAPRGIRMIRIDSASGQKVHSGWPLANLRGSVIWEAFKPDSGARLAIRQDDIESLLLESAASDSTASGRSDKEFLEERGGIY